MLYPIDNLLTEVSSSVISDLLRYFNAGAMNPSEKPIYSSARPGIFLMILLARIIETCRRLRNGLSTLMNLMCVIQRVHCNNILSLTKFNACTVEPADYYLRLSFGHLVFFSICQNIQLTGVRTDV